MSSDEVPTPQLLPCQEELKLTSSGWSQASAGGRSECTFLVAVTPGREF